MKKVFILLGLLILLGGGFFYWRGSSEATTTFRTASVRQGDLTVTISATGTIEPEEVVDVGAQVAGIILSFGTDADGKTVDYGSAVEEGTVLANIDDSLYAADLASAVAQLEQNKANVRRAEADLIQMKAKLFQAEQNWKRAQELGPSGALSATDYDSFKAGYEVALATVGVGEATVEQVRKSVAQAEASMVRVRSNLGYCTIRSPVKGVIIDRRVNIGQTVVSSLNAPSLFLIAKDLRKMQVWVAVNEADIGLIHAGQPVQFTVDAFPGRKFKGSVGKIRLNASMTQNVVTYTVEIVTDNSDGKLLPYLTANVLFELDSRQNALMVPNAALRWTPTTAMVAPEFRETAAENRQEPVSGQAEAATTAPSANAAEEESAGVIYIPQGPFVRPVIVRVGATDGTMTEVSGEGVVENLVVVTGVQKQATAQSETTNPFTPKLPRFGKGGPPPPPG